MSLTEFLLARIAEDEEAARVFEVHFMLLKDSSGRPLRETEPLPPRMTYMRTRAECEAKRQIVERFARLEGRMAEFPELTNGGEVAVMRLTVMDLAAVYADHPDYATVVPS